MSLDDEVWSNEVAAGVRVAAGVPGEPGRGRLYLSWGHTGDRAKGEDGVDLAMLIVFLAVPLGLAAVYGLCTCYVRCRRPCGNFNPESGWHKHNAAKRDLRAARRRAGV